MLIFVVLLLLIPIATSSPVTSSDDDFYDILERHVDSGGAELDESDRRSWSDMANEPPESNSQIANLFNEKMLRLLQTNEAQYVDSIAKYTNSDTQLLSCHKPGERMNFAVFNQLVKHLFLYFKKVEAGSISFSADSSEFVRFVVKFKAVSQDGKDVTLTWNGEANFDDTLKYFVYSKLEMTGDCLLIPHEFPTGPTEPFDQYIDRLKNSLQNDIFLANQRHQKASYDTFVNDFLIGRARVQFCEKNGKVENRKYFGDYLFKRYGDVLSYQNPVFTTENHTDYQIDAFFTITVNHHNGDVTMDKIRFRVSAQSEVIHGWPHWWVDYVEVQCPVLLNPKTDPKVIQEQFVGRVCDSIGPMINDGPSVESRTTFLSLMNSRSDGGFWATVCGQAGALFYGQLETWLEEFADTYKQSRLESSRIEDYVNFSFVCNTQLTKENGGSTVKREFRMRAYYETNQWLVKELKIGCETN